MRKFNLMCLCLLFVPVFLSLAQNGFSQVTLSENLAAAKKAYAAKDYEKAKQLYQTVAQSDPTNAGAYQGLGNCEYALGNKADALDAYNHSLAVNPNNPQLTAFVRKLKGQVVDTSMAASPAEATTPTPSTVSTPKRKGYSIQYVGPEYNLSLGPAFGLGGTGIGIDETYYFMNSNMFGLGFAGNVYLFGLDSSNLTYCGEALLQARFNWGEGSARPYVLAGGGLNAIYSTNAFSSAGSNTTLSFVTDPMMVAGGGVLFCLGQNFRLFLQAKASIVFLSGTNTTITSQGYTQTASSGGTLTYFPVQFGFGVNL